MSNEIYVDRENNQIRKGNQVEDFTGARWRVIFDELNNNLALRQREEKRNISIENVINMTKVKRK